ncbi:flagellar protein FlhE [Halotalea alkalilenta]|uniref:flagellar protein FlhE n=1 Tax=Halotalea alkalilenta TaxID=376489 RepID=UPI00048565D1|nr:flagellar protein FlhE [Halotalea alkalilenta]
MGAIFLATASMTLSPGSFAAGASWSTQLAGPVLGAPGATVRSPVLGDGETGRVTRVRWRVDYGEIPVLARLCQRSRCITLPSSSGTSAAFAGLPAGAGFHFELQRQAAKAGGRRASMAASGGLSLTVEYRPDS